MDINFKQKFINIDFDKIIKDELLDYKEYVNYKKEYNIEANKNYNKYKIYQNDLNDINKIETFSTKDKFIYTYINENKKEDLKNEMKKIILSQTKLIDNFQHYINILNTSNISNLDGKVPNLDGKVTIKEDQKGKGFLSKFFN
jgi:hypothetical protein